MLWAVKSSLNIQVVYPDYDLPEEYHRLLGSYDHVVIGRGGDIETSDGVTNEVPVIMRMSISEFLDRKTELAENLRKYSRLNIVFTDVENFNDELNAPYSEALELLSNEVYEILCDGGNIQLNLLTDRMLLSKMNNCNAGDESITLAPDGKFYICPGFYFDGLASVGNLKDGLNIPNRQLYELKYAPICRKCDAFHCKRCTWLNKKLTLELNTPSRQQCVMAHLEREASRKLLARIRSNGEFMPQISIPELDYLDPFDKISL